MHWLPKDSFCQKIAFISRELILCQTFIREDLHSKEQRKRHFIYEMGFSCFYNGNREKYDWLNQFMRKRDYVPIIYGLLHYGNCKKNKKLSRKDRKGANELLQIVRTAQKDLYVGKYEVLSGEASRKRRLSGF